MKFFHVYNDKYFAGLEKNGLINEDTGFKIQHCFAMPEEIKFNRYAAKGSKLYNYIAENHFPFYVDRIAGGITYQKYPYDKKLIAEYRNLLGEWFLGFQQHETAGNRRLDWSRVYDRMKGDPGPYDPAELRRRSVRAYAKTPEGEVLSGFSQGSPEDYAPYPYPATLADLFADYRRLFTERMQATDGMILPCDAGIQLTHLQNELGMQNFMPEVGCQRPQMRIAVALVRGMALAYGKKWGVYYECWRMVKPYIQYTMPCFNKEPGNEWYLTQETHKDDFTSYGEYGGSSRLLQRRIFYYALMAGAMFMGEEWGLNCSYLEMKGDFPLSSYGMVKKELIEFARSHRRVKAKIPFAVVVPKDVPYVCMNLNRIFSVNAQGQEEFLLRPLSPEESKKGKHLHDLLRAIYQRREEDKIGNEGHVLQNSRFGDLFDLVYEDAPEEAIKQYKLLIDGSADGHIAARFDGTVPVIRFDGDAEKLEKTVMETAREELPLTVDRFLWLLSEDENGKYLTVMNNEGNERNVEWGDRVNHAADGACAIRMKEAEDLSVLYASDPDVKLERKDDRGYSLFLPAASLAILRLGR